MRLAQGVERMELWLAPRRPSYRSVKMPSFESRQWLAFHKVAQ